MCLKRRKQTFTLDKETDDILFQAFLKEVNLKSEKMGLDLSEEDLDLMAKLLVYDYYENYLPKMINKSKIVKEIKESKK